MSLELSDDAIFQVTKVLYAEFLSEKNLKQLDPDNLAEFKQDYIKPLYPHKQSTEQGVRTYQKYTCGEYCCQFSPGRFCCCSSTPPDKQYREFGIGVCLYVKFFKHITWVLFFAAILALVSGAAYVVASLQGNLNIDRDYKGALYSTTVGTLSSQYAQCGYSTITATKTAYFQLSCSTGQLVLLAPVLSNESLPSVKTCGVENSKLSASKFIPNYAITSNITSGQSAKINLSLASSQTADGYESQYVSYNYQCASSVYWLWNLGVENRIALFTTVGIDLLIVVVFIIFLCSEHAAEKKEVEAFKARELAIHDFTIKVGGFRVNTYEQDLAEFVDGYNKLRAKFRYEDYSGEQFVDNIVQIKVPEMEQLSKAQQKRRKYYKKLYEFMEYCFFDDSIDVFKYKNSADFIRKCYGSGSSPEYIEYKSQLCKLIEKFQDSKRVQYLDTEKIQTSILMTLTNPKHKRRMIKLAKSGCFSHYLKLNGRRHEVSQPPVADMVLWENKHKFTFLRVILAWVITLGICVCSYLLVGFAKFKESQLLANQQFNFDCSMLYTTTQLQSWQQGLFDVPGNSGKYLHCYCNQNLFSSSLLDADVSTRCSSWFYNYAIYNAIPILISVGIVIYNLIVSRIYRLLSKFQAHNYLSSELYSYIIKRSFMLIMNMGLIIILLKLNFRSSFTIENLTFLFMGVYTDITSGWYYEIGVIIMLTLAINIFIPVFDMMLVSLLKCVRKCWDRRCYCRKTSQKTKKGYLELYSDDVFPIEERYSDFIALIVITLAFSAVMPVLYVIAFLSIWFTFICDKLLLFRIYQRPINYTKDLQANVLKLVYVAVMVHCVVSAFLLSEPHLSSVGRFDPALDRRLLIITTPYLIPYVALFLLLAVWAFLSTTIVQLFSWCSKRCEKQLSKIYKSKENQNLYEALSQYQINRLKNSLEIQLHASSDQDSSQQITSTTQAICKNSLLRLMEAQKKLKLQKDTVQFGVERVKLIGRPGYDQMFDDELFQRERKIKSIDVSLTDIVRRDRVSANQQPYFQNTLADLNFETK